MVVVCAFFLLLLSALCVIHQLDSRNYVMYTATSAANKVEEVKRKKKTINNNSARRMIPARMAHTHNGGCCIATAQM